MACKITDVNGTSIVDCLGDAGYLKVKTSPSDTSLANPTDQPPAATPTDQPSAATPTNQPPVANPDDQPPAANLTDQPPATNESKVMNDAEPVATVSSPTSPPQTLSELPFPSPGEFILTHFNSAADFFLQNEDGIVAMVQLQETVDAHVAASKSFAETGGKPDIGKDLFLISQCLHYY